MANEAREGVYLAHPKGLHRGLHLRGVHWVQYISPGRWGKMLWFLIFLYLALFPFGQFTRLPFPFLPNEVRVYLTDVLVGMIGVVWLFSFERGPLSKLKSFPAVVPFLVAALFSLLLAIPHLEVSEILISSLYFIRLASYFLFAGVVWSLVKTKKEQSLILGSLAIIGIAVAVFGWVQYLFYPDLKFLLAVGWDEHVNRIVGTFFDPSFTSIILVFTLILLFGRALRSSHLRGVHWVQHVSPGRWALLLVIFLALLFTYSRSGYLAFLAGAAAYSVITKNYKVVALGVLLLFSGIFLLPKQTSEGTKLERTASVLLRVENWKEGLALFKEHPLFGVGFNTLRYTRPGLVEEKYGPSHAAAGIDNSFLFVLATMGVVGFAAFVNLVVAIVKRGMESKGSRAVLIPTLVAAFVHSLFVNSLFYPWVLGWLALLFAGTLRAVKN